jgi:hypothetical protein
MPLMENTLMMNLADILVSSFKVYTPSGYLHDWNGGIVYCQNPDNAALFTFAGARDIRKRIGNACVFDENDRILTLTELSEN